VSLSSAAAVAGDPPLPAPSASPSSLASPSSSWAARAQAFVEAGPLARPGEACALATLVVLSAFSTANRVLLPLLAIGLLHRRLLERPAFWFISAAVGAANLLATWSEADNHQWLMMYWCIALGAAFAGGDLRRRMATAARRLVGLCFLFAVLWKVMTPDFLDGTFWQVALVGDRRFEVVARLVGGLAEGELAALRRTVEQAAAGTAPPVVMATAVPGALATLGRVISVWTLAIEGLIAASFLARAGTRLSRLRNAALLVFLASTYPIAPVTGFGWLLTVMGMAQTAPAERRGRLAYAAAFVAIPFFHLLATIARP
jgi:hypothetical protein